MNIEKNYPILPKSLNGYLKLILIILLPNYKLKKILIKIFYWITILLTTLKYFQPKKS